MINLDYHQRCVNPSFSWIKGYITVPFLLGFPSINFCHRTSIYKSFIVVKLTISKGHPLFLVVLHLHLDQRSNI